MKIGSATGENPTLDKEMIYSQISSWGLTQGSLYLKRREWCWVSSLHSLCLAVNPFFTLKRPLTLASHEFLFNRMVIEGFQNKFHI